MIWLVFFFVASHHLMVPLVIHVLHPVIPFFPPRQSRRGSTSSPSQSMPAFSPPFDFLSPSTLITWDPLGSYSPSTLSGLSWFVFSVVIPNSALGVLLFPSSPFVTPYLKFTKPSYIFLCGKTSFFLYKALSIAALFFPPRLTLSFLDLIEPWTHCFTWYQVTP